MATQQEQEQSISANLFGQSVAAKGTSGIIILVLLCLSGGLGYLLYERSTESEQHVDAISAIHTKARTDQTIQMATEHQAIVQGLKDMRDVSESINESIKVQNYINLADEKKKLEIKSRLDMPESLRKRGFN